MKISIYRIWLSRQPPFLMLSAHLPCLKKEKDACHPVGNAHRAVLCWLEASWKGGLSVGIKLFCHSRGPQVVGPKHCKMSCVTWLEMLQIFVSRSPQQLHFPDTQVVFLTQSFFCCASTLNYFSLELVHCHCISNTTQSQRSLLHTILKTHRSVRRQSAFLSLIPSEISNIALLFSPPDCAQQFCMDMHPQWPTRLPTPQHIR